MRTVQELLELIGEARTEAFLDGLTLGRLERQRKEADFPVAPSPSDEHIDGWPYPDEDDDTA